MERWNFSRSLFVLCRVNVLVRCARFSAFNRNSGAHIFSYGNQIYTVGRFRKIARTKQILIMTETREARISQGRGNNDIKSLVIIPSLRALQWIADLKSSDASFTFGSACTACLLHPHNLMEIPKIVSYLARFNDSARIQHETRYCLLERCTNSSRERDLENVDLLFKCKYRFAENVVFS